MFRIVNHLRISTAIKSIVVLSIIFIFLIGIVGYIDIKKMNINGSEIYHESLIPISEVSEIGIEFAKYRLIVTKILLGYNRENEFQIKEIDNNINTILNKYASKERYNNMDKKTKQEIDKLKDNYSTYIEKWNEVNNMLKKSGNISSDDIDEFMRLAKEIQNCLDNLKYYTLESAKKLDNESDRIYRESIKIFLIILITVITTLIIISYLVIRKIKNSLKDIIEDLERISQGDFRLTIDNSSRNEFGIMKAEIYKTIKNISSVFEDVKEESKNIDEIASNLSSLSYNMASSSENVVHAIEDVAKGTTSQAEDLSDINAALNQFAHELNKIVTSIENIDLNSKEIHNSAGESTSSMEIMIESLEKVEGSFNDLVSKISSVGLNIDKINTITNLINNISDQTNLLALNAAIEAARAGEAGRGFAVVANEIRKLAEQSKTSSEKINSLISDISSDTYIMVKTTDIMKNEMSNQKKDIGSTINSFKRIIEGVEDIIPKIEQANISVKNIDSEKNNILEKIENASAIAQEISASAEEITAMSQETSSSINIISSTANKLNDMTKDTIEKIDKFKL